jgi:hypothetical protein
MKSFFPSTNNNLNISNLVNDSDSNNSEKKNVHIENFHSIIDHAKNKVNEIYNDAFYGMNELTKISLYKSNLTADSIDYINSLEGIEIIYL